MKLLLVSVRGRQPPSSRTAGKPPNRRQAPKPRTSKSPTTCRVSYSIPRRCPNLICINIRARKDKHAEYQVCYQSQNIRIYIQHTYTKQKIKTKGICCFKIVDNCSRAGTRVKIRANGQNKEKGENRLQQKSRTPLSQMSPPFLVSSLAQ